MGGVWSVQDQWTWREVGGEARLEIRMIDDGNCYRTYAQTLIFVKLIVVKNTCFLDITRNPVGISGPY